MFYLELGRNSFKTKKAAAEFVRGMLRDIGCCSRILSLPKGREHFTIFKSLLQFHPNRDEKLEDLSDFCVQPNKLNPRAHELYVVTTHGNLRDVSWLKCISGNSTSLRHKFMSACRTCIADQIHAYKSANLHPDSVCALCDCPVFGEHNIDHVINFVQLVDNFVAKHQIIIPLKYGSECGTNRYMFLPADAAIDIAFSSYHK